MIKFLTDWELPVEGAYTSFTVDEETWIVPFYGAFPKIIDFGGVISPELGLNSVMATKNIPTRQINNDMEWLLSFVYHRASSNGLGRITALVNALDPRLHHYNVLPSGAKSMDFPSLDEMLHNEIFTSFTDANVLQKKHVNIYVRYAINSGVSSRDGNNANSADKRTNRTTTTKKSDKK
jgi:hypothetical protein